MLQCETLVVGLGKGYPEAFKELDELTNNFLEKHSDLETDDVKIEHFVGSVILKPEIASSDSAVTGPVLTRIITYEDKGFRML